MTELYEAWEDLANAVGIALEGRDGPSIEAAQARVPAAEDQVRAELARALDLLGGRR